MKAVILEIKTSKGTIKINIEECNNDNIFIQSLEQKIKNGEHIESIKIKETNPCDVSNMSYREYSESILKRVDY